jgi:hypothetical protein
LNNAKIQLELYLEIVEAETEELFPFESDCLLSSFSKEKLIPRCTITKLWCPRYDHFDKGEQKAYELFGTSCLICFEKAADAVDRIRAPCGKFW